MPKRDIEACFKRNPPTAQTWLPFLDLLCSHKWCPSVRKEAEKSCHGCMTWIELYYFSDKSSCCSLALHIFLLSVCFSALSCSHLAFSFFCHTHTHSLSCSIWRNITVGQRHLIPLLLYGQWQKRRAECSFPLPLRSGRSEQTQPPSRGVNSVSTFYLSSRLRASASNMAARRSVTLESL